MAQQKIDVSGGEQIQGVVPLVNGGTGSTSLSGAGIEQTANKNANSGYAGLTSTGVVAVTQGGTGTPNHVQGYWVDAYGADPTGTGYSDTAIAAAVTALGANPGAIVFGPGTYKCASSIGTFGAGQSIIGAGMGLTTINYSGTGDCIYVKGTSLTNPPIAGVIYGLTISGTTSGVSGIHAGDIYSLKIDNVFIISFAGTGAKGLWLDDRVAWMENCDINVMTNNCTTAVLFDGSNNADQTYSSFDYSRYRFEIIPFANQNGVTLHTNVILAGVDMTIIGNAQAGTGSNTGAILTVGTTGTDQSQIGAGSKLNISMECDGTSGQVGHAAINVGAEAILVASGSLNFANYVSGLTFTPGTINGIVGFTALNNQINGSAIGMLSPVQTVAVGTETFTIASGTVTTISGTTLNGYTPAIGDRIAVVNAPATTGTGGGNAYSYSTEPANGIYIVTGNTTNLSVSRAADMMWSHPAGLSVYIENGSSWNGGNFITVINPASHGSQFVYGTTSMEWTCTGGSAPSYSGGIDITTNVSFWNGTGFAALQGNSSASGSQTLNLPATATSDTLVGRASTDTLTNKTLTSPTLTTPVLGTPSSGTLTNCTGLPVAGGGTGAATLTGLVKGNGTSAMTAVTAPTGTVVGTTDTQTLTNKIIPTLIGTPVVNGASSLTLTNTDSMYVFTGSSATTWTLPAVSGNTGVFLILENRGSAAITVVPAGSDHIWFLSSITTFTIAIGGSLYLINDGIYWNTLSLDLVNNSVGVLPVASGGSGASTLTGLVQGNGTSAMTAVTAPTGTVVGTTDTQTLTNKTESGVKVTGYTETVQTSMGQVTAGTHAIPALSTGTMAQVQLPTTGAVTLTMPTAVAGASFMMRLQQAATGLTATVTFTGVIWPNSVAYVPTSAASQYDLLSFCCFDGTHWDGSYQQSYSA